jgi:transaldolase
VRNTLPVYLPLQGEETTEFLKNEFARRYATDLAEEHIALEKVEEGLEKFSIDAVKLRDLLRTRILNGLNKD